MSNARVEFLYIQRSNNLLHKRERKMKYSTAMAMILAFAAYSVAEAAEDPQDVTTVVNAVKAANSDFRALCLKGADGIRKAVTEATATQAASGNVKGNPQAVGAEAGQKVGRECRGG
jgi:hypothetical protein